MAAVRISDDATQNAPSRSFFPTFKLRYPHPGSSHGQTAHKHMSYSGHPRPCVPMSPPASAHHSRPLRLPRASRGSLPGRLTASAACERRGGLLAFFASLGLLLSQFVMLQGRKSVPVGVMPLRPPPKLPVAILQRRRHTLLLPNVAIHIATHTVTHI